MPLIQSKANIYTDIDLNMFANPNTGDIGILNNINAVKRSIRHSIFFDKFDIPFDDVNYSNIKRLLFEPISTISASILSNRILNIIERLDPRVNIVDIKVRANNTEDGYDVNIIFNVNYLQDNQTLQIFLQRNR